MENPQVLVDILCVYSWPAIVAMKFGFDVHPYTKLTLFIK